ncbi:phage minor structural protein [Staphylococcus aureus]|uniref:Phage minor structural protein n=1 Tax=Staphylococcus aureus TaxID=1280 RepID=A0A380DV38_STAAU|nr:phage minor structural protein [Staphylococcus aureus]
MIHVLDFNDKIIDFLSTDDPSLVRAIHKRNVNDNSEMLELLISSERAEKFRERHRVIIGIQTNNGVNLLLTGSRYDGRLHRDRMYSVLSC